MLYRHHIILRKRERNGFIGRAASVFAAIVIGLLFPMLVNAYTVVLRDGRSVNIPDKFQVTETALTYETARGILVTLPLASIDITATEKANGSPVGALLARVGRDFPPERAGMRTSTQRRATRTLTNMDLEQTRLARIASEAAYEARRKELGLPSKEESDIKRQEEAVRLRALFEQSEIENSESERYWRSRATALRNEIFVVDSEINFLRARLVEISDQTFYAPYATYGNYGAYANFRTRASRISVGNGAGIVSVQPQSQSRGAVAVLPSRNNSLGQRQYGYDRRTNHCRFAPCNPTFGVTYPYNQYSYNGSVNLARLNDLVLTRTTLDAQWQILEDEARRAGAQPGWLRP